MGPTMRVVFVLLIASIPTVYSAAYFVLGKCPDGHNPGDSWGKENQCMECYCTSEGHGCSSCGVEATQNKPNCYVDSTPEAPYPECCRKFHVCQGDQDFDQNKYNTYMQQLVGK